MLAAYVVLKEAFDSEHREALWDSCKDYWFGEWLYPGTGNVVKRRKPVLLLSRECGMYRLD